MVVIFGTCEKSKKPILRTGSSPAPLSIPGNVFDCISCQYFPLESEYAYAVSVLKSLRF
jgi:hypothetical protein